MTTPGKPYYPLWLDNLADDVTLGRGVDGAHGADAVPLHLGQSGTV
jgi:hypothetical protein